MTNGQIWDEYLRMETAGNKIMVGADPDLIIKLVAEDTGRTECDVRAIVLARTLNRAGG